MGTLFLKITKSNLILTKKYKCIQILKIILNLLSEIFKHLFLRVNKLLPSNINLMVDDRHCLMANYEPELAKFVASKYTISYFDGKTLSSSKYQNYCFCIIIYYLIDFFMILLFFHF